MDTKEIYILRHGQTDFNLKRIIQGSGVDSSLNETGLKQAHQFYVKYKNQNFDLVFTSALQRTKQTVQSFIDMDIPWIAMSELNEIGWGIHEGKEGTDAMIAHYNEVTNAWKSGQYDIGIEGGETAQELKDRMLVFIEQLKERPEQKILVCSHGRAMRCLMCLLDGNDIHRMDEYGHHNTGLYIVEYANNAFALNAKNDISHLEN